MENYNTLYKLLKSKHISIPLIQRDYAQGRESAGNIRKIFLSKIKKILQGDNTSINLDFIYGFSKNGDFIPLDGQQRLTTLWLIHWYFILKEGYGNKYLTKFTYETRISARRFCEKLVTNSTIELLNSSKISSVITDASWFMASWNNDPTIIAILNMIDAIHEELNDCENVCEKLIEEERITFDYIDIRAEEFKLTDELYIKMNSRGKPLTDFENFKAQFSDLLSKEENEYHNEELEFNNTKISYKHYFAFKVDTEWTDLFWKFRDKSDLKLDEYFLNFIYFIAEMLHYRENKHDGFKRDFENLEKLEKLFSNKENILFLFNSLDLFAKIEENDDFFSTIFSIKNQSKRINIFEKETTNLFWQVITNKANVKTKVLLYSLIKYCIINNMQNVPSEGLKSTLRIVRNLVLAIRKINDKKKIDYDNNPFIYDFYDYSKVIDSFIETFNQNNDLLKSLGNINVVGFSESSVRHEKYKLELLRNNPALESRLYLLENHEYIQGNLTCFDLESSNIKDKIVAFLSIWNENIHNPSIIRAMLTFGNYSIRTHPNSSLPIYYFGYKDSWNRILTTGFEDEMEKIKPILDNFLNTFSNSEGESTTEKLEKIIQGYLSKVKEDSKNFYMIKYEAMTNIEAKYNLFAEDAWDEWNNLGGFGTRPLLSNHVNPIIATLKKELLNNNINCTLWEGKHIDGYSCLVHSKLTVHSRHNKWYVYLHKEVLRKGIIDKYDIKVSKDNDYDYYIFDKIEDKDRIETAVEFLKDVLKK